MGLFISTVERALRNMDNMRFPYYYSPVKYKHHSHESAMLGTIRWEVDKDFFTSFFSNHCGYSPTIKVGGMQWRLYMPKYNGKNHLSVYLYLLNSDYAMQSVDLAYEIKIINHIDNAKTIKRKVFKKFERCPECWGFPEFIEWKEAIDEEKGFIKDNKWSLQVQFSLSKYVGSRKLSRVDFTHEKEPNHDMVLVIEGKNIYVSKQYLSSYSSFFHTLFYGDFSEMNQNKIVLKDIDCNEFIELLNVIYPPFMEITDDNAYYLLRLADRFDMDWVIHKCEQYFITSSKFSVAAKLVTASEYRLPGLQNVCLDQFKSIHNMKDLKNSDEFDNFSDDIKASLFDKMMNI